MKLIREVLVSNWIYLKHTYHFIVIIVGNLADVINSVTVGKQPGRHCRVVWRPNHDVERVCLRLHYLCFWLRGSRWAVECFRLTDVWRMFCGNTWIDVNRVSRYSSQNFWVRVDVSETKLQDIVFQFLFHDSTLGLIYASSMALINCLQISLDLYTKPVAPKWGGIPNWSGVSVLSRRWRWW